MEPIRKSERIAEMREREELKAALAAIAKMEAQEAQVQGGHAQVAPLPAQEDPLPDLSGLDTYVEALDGGPLKENELAFENEEGEEGVAQAVPLNQQNEGGEQQVIVISSSSSSSSSVPALEDVGSLSTINTPPQVFYASDESSPFSGFNIPKVVIPAAAAETEVNGNDEETEAALKVYLDSQAQIDAFEDAINEEKATMAKKVAVLSSKTVVKVKSHQLFGMLKKDGLTNIKLEGNDNPDN